MKVRNTEWRTVSASSKLRALDVAVICASALFWSWFTLAIMEPTFFTRLSAQTNPLSFRVASLVSGTIVFVVCAIRPQFATKLLDSRKCEVAAVAIAVAAGGLALAGSLSLNVALAMIGAVAMGAMFPYFLLEWCRMYSRQGARTAAPLVSGALALSIPIDIAASSFEPIARCIWVALMPILIVAVLALIQALAAQPGESKLSLGFFANGTAVGASEMLISDPNSEKPPKRARKRLTVLESPLALPASAVAYGIAFGLLNISGAISENSNVVQLGLCFTAALLCFLASCAKPLAVRPTVDFFQLAGIAGALMLILPPELIEPVRWLAYAALLAGFISFLVAFWTLGGYYATGKKEQVVPLFSLCLAALCVGLLAGIVCQSVVLWDPLNDIWHCIIAFLIVLASTLLAAAGSLPINVFKVAIVSSDTGGAPTTNFHADLARSIASEHELTERETEILGLLISGRSRPRIAETLCVSENTVNSHIQHIYRKLDVHSFQELLDFIYHAENQ